jgi:hypothetical protein
MMAPRPTLITNNAFDSCCFRGDYANSPLIWAARPFFALYDAADRLTYHINFDAGHNYGQDNREAFYGFLRDNFDPNLPVKEIPSDREVRTAEQLRVELPADNLDFHELALKLSRESTKTRETLADIVRPKTYTIAATEVASTVSADIGIKHWKLRMSNDWTVPVVELIPQASSRVRPNSCGFEGDPAGSGAAVRDAPGAESTLGLNELTASGYLSTVWGRNVTGLLVISN